MEAVGRNITKFKPDDEVFGTPVNGGFAEYALASERALVLKPAKLSFEQAAAIPLAALTALQGMRNVGKIQAGQSLLINGTPAG